MDRLAAKAVLFAVDVIESQWDASNGGPSDEGQMILDAAENIGLIHWRKPTPAELADDEWWGHEFDIGPDTNGVGELTPEFIALTKRAKAALAMETV